MPGVVGIGGGKNYVGWVLLADIEKILLERSPPVIV
jgi:hypothetical protein